MSFILDALKKSEAERQRKSVPGFADIPDGRSASRSPPWWWVVGGILAINSAALFAVFFLSDRSGGEVVETVRREPRVPEAVTESPVATKPAAFSDIVAEARKNRLPEDRPTTTEPQRQGPAPSAALPQSRVTMSEQLATINELRAEGSLQLPELHLDIHVFSENPAERFIFINMAKYKEGDALGEGPVVREIRTDGVVLDHRGTRFLMPRQ
jgi:general secretion pathway protein B